MPLPITHPWDPAAFERFRDGYFYAPEALLISAVTLADRDNRVLEARSDAGMQWLVAPYQRGDDQWHPRHVSGADLLMLTGTLGSLHAFFFHDCLWEEGWVGFGNRIESAEFKALARVDKPLLLRSTETKTRRGERRTLLEYAFVFTQDGKDVYTSKQTALFMKK